MKEMLMSRYDHVILVFFLCQLCNKYPLLTFNARVTDVMARANKVKSAYLEHSYLWIESRTEFMHYFLTYSRQLTTEEIESLEEDDKAVKKQYPSLDQV